MTSSKSALAVLAAMITTMASAQQSPMPADIEWKLQELGRVIDPPKTGALYVMLPQHSHMSEILFSTPLRRA